jgi:hypothetical protein
MYPASSYCLHIVLVTLYNCITLPLLSCSLMQSLNVINQSNHLFHYPSLIAFPLQTYLKFKQTDQIQSKIALLDNVVILRVSRDIGFPNFERCACLGM